MRWLFCCFRCEKEKREEALRASPRHHAVVVASNAQKQEHTNAAALPPVPCQNHSSADVPPARISNSTKADSNPEDLCKVRPDLSGSSTAADESTNPCPNPSTEVVPPPVHANPFPDSSTEVVEPLVNANPCPDSSTEVASPLSCDPYPNSSTDVAPPLVSEVVSDSVTTTPSKDGNENMPQHAREEEASESSPVEGRKSNVSTTTTTTNPWLEVDELDAELAEVRRKLTKESADTQRLQNEVKYWQTCDTLLTPEEIKDGDASDWHSWFTSPLSKMDQIWVEAAESSSPADQDSLSCAPTPAEECGHLSGKHPVPLPMTFPSTRPKQEQRGLPQAAINKSPNRGGRDGGTVMVQSILSRNKKSEAEDISSSPASISGSLLGGYGYYSPASESTISWKEKSPPTTGRGVSSLSPSLSSPALPFKGRSTLQSRYRRFEEGSNGENISQRGGRGGEDCDDSLSDTAALYRRKSESIVMPRRRRPSSPSPQWQRSVLTPVENLSKWKCLKEEERDGLVSDVGPGFPRRRSCEMLDDCFIERSRGSASELLLQRQKRVARVLQLKSENNGGEVVNSASGARLHATAALCADARLSHWPKPPPVPKEYNNNNNSNNSSNNNNSNNSEYLHVSDTPENKAQSPANSSSSQVHTPETSVDGGGGVPSSSSSIDGVTRVTDRPILGSVAAYWGSLSGSTRGGTWWDGKGIPNSTTKYRENQKVNWRSTPFEVRVDRELEKEALVMQKNLFG